VAPPTATTPLDPTLDLPLSGWWRRVGVTVIDGIALNMVARVVLGLVVTTSAPMVFKDSSMAAYDAHVLFNWLVPVFIWGATVSLALSAIYNITLWQWRGQTLGNMTLGSKIVRASDGELPTLRQCVVRWSMGEFLPSMVAFIGFGIVLLQVKSVVNNLPLASGSLSPQQKHELLSALAEAAIIFGVTISTRSPTG
jgi:uncharacterized RDD family membrane protein YckC